MDFINDLVPVLLAIAVTAIAVLGIRRWIGKQRGRVTEIRWRKQLWTLVVLAIGLGAVLVLIPEGNIDKQSLVAVFGLILTAIIALSATTIVSNAMAGLMLHVVGNFKPGDFVRVGEHFGRVTERGLFHTEILTEDRDLTTVPNLMLVTNAVTVIHADGTIVSAQVTLGYDLHRSKIEPLLLQAAEGVGLEEPFAQVIELGDYAVTYRVAGFLAEVKQILSFRSNLRKSILDVLSEAGVEIVSPAFMNQRQIGTRPVVPDFDPGAVEPSEESAPEEIVFDKAEMVETVEQLREQQAALADHIKALNGEMKSANPYEKESIQTELSVTESQKSLVEARIEELESTLG